MDYRVTQKDLEAYFYCQDKGVEVEPIPIDSKGSFVMQITVGGKSKTGKIVWKYGQMKEAKYFTMRRYARF